jgi:hypothetical protein
MNIQYISYYRNFIKNKIWTLIMPTLKHLTLLLCTLPPFMHHTIASFNLEPYLNLRFKTLVNFFKNLPISYNIIKLDVTCVCTLIFWCLFLRKLYQINFFLEAWPIFGRGTRLQSSFLGPFILGVNYYILKNIYFCKSDEFLLNKHVIHWKNTVYQIVFEKMKKI